MLRLLKLISITLSWRRTNAAVKCLIIVKANDYSLAFFGDFSHSTERHLVTADPCFQGHAGSSSVQETTWAAREGQSTTSFQRRGLGSAHTSPPLILGHISVMDEGA